MIHITEYHKHLPKEQRIIHAVYEEVPYYNSMAAYLMLKNRYARQDPTRKGLFDWRYYFIARRTFLRHKKQEHGGFYVCHYCGTVMESLGKRCKRNHGKECVTVDHIVPKTECNDYTDSKNFVECCLECNRTKGAKSYQHYVKDIGGVPEIEKLTNFNKNIFSMSNILAIFNFN